MEGQQEVTQQQKQQELVNRQNRQRLKTFSMEIAVKNNEGKSLNSQELIDEAQKIFNYMNE